MKTFIITAAIPQAGSGGTAEVTIIAPPGKVFHRGPIQPSHVADLESDDYPLDLMRRMFPVAATKMHGHHLNFDSNWHDHFTHGRLRVWYVDTDDF